MNGTMRRLLQVMAVLSLALLLGGALAQGAGAEIIEYKDTIKKSTFKTSCIDSGGSYSEEHGGNVGICTSPDNNQNRCDFKTHYCSVSIAPRQTPPSGPARVPVTGKSQAVGTGGAAPSPTPVRPGAAQSGGLS